MLFAALPLAVPAEAEDMPAAPQLTAVPATVAGRTPGPNIFGTIALPIRPKPTSTRWAKLMFAKLEQPSLIHLVESANALPPQQQVAYVQSAINQWVRASTVSEDCSDNGYWPSAEETLMRGAGNCFGIAIAKMEALRMLGMETESLFLTTGRFRSGPDGAHIRESAALLVRIGEDYWLLPEQTDTIVAAGASPSGSFSPVLTYGVRNTWIHGRLTSISALTE